MCPQQRTMIMEQSQLKPVKFKRNAEEELNLAIEKANLPVGFFDEDNSSFTTNLGAHVRRCWNLARMAKQRHQRVLLQCLRQREGVYDPSVLDQIRKQGSSEIFMQLTQLKIRAAKAWVGDIMLRDPTDLPFTLNSTPIPDLPQNIMEEINFRIFQEAQEALSLGLYPTQTQISHRQQQVYDSVMREYNKFSKTRSKRMEKYIKDVMIEANFRHELNNFIDDFFTHPAAFMKGPYNIMANKLEWMFMEDNNVQAKVARKVKREFKAVSPFDIYPAPDARSVQDGYLIEKMTLRRKNIYDLIGVSGYDEESIRDIIDQYGDNGYQLPVHEDSERDRLEGRDHDEWSNDTTIDVINFWGQVRGSWLLEQGVDGSLIGDPDDDYEANIMMVGDIVFKATLNQHPLGKRPYGSSSLEASNNTIWGKGLSQIMSDLQRMCNASARSLANNMGISSGPMVEVDVERLAPGENPNDIYPWRVWQTNTNRFGSNGKAINFFQANSNANELIQVYKFFASLADEYTGIPPYVLGQNVGGGASNTASGLSMLIESAARGIKLAIKQLDAVVENQVELTFESVMIHDNVPEIKGDLIIKATGTDGVLIQEQQNMRRLELFNIISNPAVSWMTGPNAIIKTLKQIYESVKLDPSVLPSEDEIRSMMIQRQREMAAQEATPPSSGISLGDSDAAGNKSGGADVNVVQ